MEKLKSQINNACAQVRTRKNGNRFIEQYEWTIGVCITVQIGERGNFTDVQIGERGKQRVNNNQLTYLVHSTFMYLGEIECVYTLLTTK